MNHARAREFLNAYLEGDLSPNDREQVELHLTACSPCAEELADLRETVSLLHRLADPEPPAHLTASVLARIADGEGTPPWYARRLRPLLAPFAPTAAFASAAVAALALFLGLGDLLGARSGPALEGFPGTVVEGAIAGTSPDLTRRPSDPGGVPATPALARAEAGPRLAGAPSFDPINRDPDNLRAAFRGTAMFDPGVNRLDSDLELLMRDPDAFLDRMSRVGESGSSIEPLVQRSVTRGNAPDAALVLRLSEHPLAAPAAERFERASLDR